MEAVLHGPLGRTALGSGELAIGYDPDNQLIVTDIKTAAHHALIRPAESGYAIVDLGSAYGTRVNGQWLTPDVARPLQTGDVIQIGDTCFTYDTSPLPPVAVDASVTGANGGQASAFAFEAFTPAPSVADTNYGSDGLFAPHPQVIASSPIAPAQLSYTPQPWVAGGMTVYPAQARLWQKDRKRAFISLGVMVAVLIVSSVLFVVLTRSTPDKTLDSFCSGLLSQNGQLAYNQLSVKYQKQFFVGTFSSIKAATCTHAPAVVNGSTATASITIALAQTPQSPSSSSTLTAMLVQDANGAWKIDNLQTQQGPNSNG